MHSDSELNSNSIPRRIADHVLPPLAWLICRTLGVITWCFTNRREVATRNLAHAFPERSEAWHRKIAFKSVLRMFELFAIPTVLPWLSGNELRKRFSLAEGAEGRLDVLTGDEASIVQSPHCAMMESLAMLPELHKGTRFTTVYRPFDFSFAEKYVLWARSRWGMKFLSRKAGLLGIRHALGNGDNVGILFDQNAMTAGALILSFGRICSSTDLPGILASKLHIKTYIIHARRTGFLCAVFDLIEVKHDGTTPDITARTSLILENMLRKDEEACADWMWAHRRWKIILRGPERCLNNTHKKNYLDYSVRAMGLSELPRRQPYCVRVPENRAMAELLVAWLPRLREQRKDVRWIILAPEMAKDLFREGENCERLVSFGPGGLKVALQSMASEWTEMFMSFQPDSDTRAEAKLCRAQYSLGITSKGAKGARGHMLLPDARASDPAQFEAVLRDYFRFSGMDAPE